jgi:site-specific recombinase XerD
MTPLQQQFIDQLRCKGLSECTVQSYTANVKGLTLHYRCNPLDLTKQQIQYYLLFLRREKKYAPSTINQITGSLKTFFNLMAPDSTVMGSCHRMKVPHRLYRLLQTTRQVTPA